VRTDYNKNHDNKQDGVLIMAEIKPFRALRFTNKAGFLSELICPPYSSIREEHKRELLSKNSNNIVHFELWDKPYSEAAQELSKWETDGIFKQDSSPAIFIYEDEFTVYGQKRKTKGLLCRVKLEDYESQVILPHEETLSKQRIDRFQLLKTTFCNFSPVYSLYRDCERVTAERMAMLTKSKPRYEFTADGVTRRIWIVNDAVAVAAFCEDFADRNLFIAEGHHRYEAALQLRDWCREEQIREEGESTDYVLMALTDMDNSDLTLFPTHRLIHGLKKFDKTAFLKHCGQYFDVIEREHKNEIETNLDALYRQGKTAFACYFGEEGWSLLIGKDFQAVETLLPEKSESYRNLDAVILQTLLLEQGLGIDEENIAQQINLSYTDSFEKGFQSVQNRFSQCAIFINPARVKQICDLALTGETLPRQSAHFYPQPPAGLVINKMNPS
jgi:uncharacterized protein (DUF1015 family)